MIITIKHSDETEIKTHIDNGNWMTPIICDADNEDEYPEGIEPCPNCGQNEFYTFNYSPDNKMSLINCDYCHTITFIYE